MRKREIASTLIVTVALCELSRWAFSSEVKRRARAKRTDIKDKSLLEVHHIVPEHLTHDDSPKNAVALTREGHALAHYLRALVARSRKEQRLEFEAVELIVQRMTPEELERFNRDIVRRRV